MSLDIASERVCYVHCNFCNTILATIPLQALQRQLSCSFQDVAKTCESESKFRNFTQFEASGHELRIPPIRSREKRQRVPSLYNRFIKEEIQRIKASNPRISHREAFSTAAKNWAHFPHIHFGLKMDGNKRTKLDDEIAGEGT